ncbi:MAG: hypothetical protein ACP5OG_03170 [Candidatus Nanoarchaeia archaeon]
MKYSTRPIVLNRDYSNKLERLCPYADNNQCNIRALEDLSSNSMVGGSETLDKFCLGNFDNCSVYKSKINKKNK